MVPPSARATGPPALVAPVNAPARGEELALDRVAGIARSSLHERLFAPRAPVVDGAGEQLLAVPVSPRISTLASVAATCDTPCRRGAAPAATDDLVEAVVGLDLLAQVLGLRVSERIRRSASRPLVHVPEDQR